jgi:L-ascorbate metabolism protein UlaG (beta-lactamase superfamily)
MFGRLPSGERLAKIEKLSNYKDGKFHNLRETQMITGNMVGATLKFLYARIGFLSKIFSDEDAEQKPSLPLPTVKTDLKNLDPKEDVVIWFGHSSYLIQLNGKRVLVDPLFSKVSSPVWFFPKAFDGTDAYGADDMPELDCLIITHDHWDHLDYKTVLRLKNKVKKIVCPIGVGEHFEYWGFPKEQIVELYWGDDVSFGDNFKIHCLPARHFTGRGIFRNKSLWGSFLIDAKNFKIYVGGDSGYDAHYAEIGNKFGPIDLVILNSGQYNKDWKHNHMAPDEVIKASEDLCAKMLLPVHICKISLAHHSWYEPLAELSRMSDGRSFLLLTPMIGEKVNLRSNSKNAQWWEFIRP